MAYPLVQGHVFVADYRAALDVLDVNVAHLRAVEEAGIGWNHDGIGARGDARIAHTGFDLTAAVRGLHDLAADYLLHAGGAKPAVDKRAHDLFLALATEEGAGNSALGRAVVGRTDADNVPYKLRAVVHAHPIASQQSALGMPHEDHLFRAGDGKDGVDVGVELPGGFLQGSGGAGPVVRGEGGPASGAEHVCEDLPDAFTVAGSVDQNNRPGSFGGGARGPVVFAHASRPPAGTEGECGHGIAVYP